MYNCLNHINTTMEYINLALYEFNHDATMKCYPGFSHNELSDVLLNSKQLVTDYILNMHTWINYKQG